MIMCFMSTLGYMPRVEGFPQCHTEIVGPVQVHSFALPSVSRYATTYNCGLSGILAGRFLGKVRTPLVLVLPHMFVPLEQLRCHLDKVTDCCQCYMRLSTTSVCVWHWVCVVCLCRLSMCVFVRCAPVILEHAAMCGVHFSVCDSVCRWCRRSSRRFPRRLPQHSRYLQ